MRTTRRPSSGTLWRWSGCCSKRSGSYKIGTRIDLQLRLEVAVEEAALQSATVAGLRAAPD